jgi:hypothetical protein
MKKQIILTALLATSAITLLAQDADTGAPAGRPPGHRPPPLIAALDANKDGVIDATELANATAALLTLDKNGDGQLTRDELMGDRGEGQGPRGPRGPGGPAGAGHRGPRPAPPQQ